MRTLLPHHYAWLSTHPNRDEDWLHSAISMGLAIYHIDGDSNNNAPDNLILMEHADCMFLHGANRVAFIKSKGGRKGARQEKLRKRIERAMRIYEKQPPMINQRSI